MGNGRLRKLCKMDHLCRKQKAKSTIGQGLQFCDLLTSNSLGYGGSLPQVHEQER